MEYGFVDGFQRAGDALRRIIFGYDMSNPKDKQAKENVEYAVETPTLEVITGRNLTEDVKNVFILVGVIILVIFTIND